MALIKVQKRAKPGFVFLLDERDFLKAQDVWIRDEEVPVVTPAPPADPVVSETPVAPTVVADETPTPEPVVEVPAQALPDTDPVFYRRPVRRRKAASED